MDAAPGVPVWVVVTPLVVFGFTPTFELVTRIVTVQLSFAGIVRPLNVNDVSPLAKLLPLAPVHVPPAFCAPLMLMFANASVNVAPVNANPFVFDKVNVMVEVLPD